MGKLEIDLKKKGGGEWKQVTRTRENGINSDVLLCVLSGYKREGGFLVHISTLFSSPIELFCITFKQKVRKAFLGSTPRKHDKS